jgi:hypothetical protein
MYWGSAQTTLGELTYGAPQTRRLSAGEPPPSFVHCKHWLYVSPSGGLTVYKSIFGGFMAKPNKIRLLYGSGANIWLCGEVTIFAKFNGFVQLSLHYQLI